MKTKEEITDPIGARTYSPDEEIARKAPAIVCNVACRVKRLRDKLTKLKKDHSFDSKFKMNLHELEVFLLDSIAPLPFEAELLSGDITKVDEALRQS